MCIRWDVQGYPVEKAISLWPLSVLRSSHGSLEKEEGQGRVFPFSGGEKQAGVVAERAMQVDPGACPACLVRLNTEI